MIEANYIDRYGVLHACPIDEDDLKTGGYSPITLSYACGCTPGAHRFQCVWCRRIVGWCMGSAHDRKDVPEDICDECLIEVEHEEEAS